MAFLAGRQLRVTAQRQAIIDTVFSTEEHFTADQLLEWSQQRDRSVSRATVYRTLPLLTESGLVRELDFGRDHKVYDALVRAIPMKRVGQPDDLPGIVAFLASDQASYISGQAISINGAMI